MTLAEGKEKKPPRFLTVRRVAWGIVGLIWFLWIGYEDRGPTPILLLSGMIAFSIGLEIRTRWVGNKWSKTRNTFRWITLGTMSGAIVGPIAVTLALLKTSLHQHAVADFSIDDLLALAERVPIWAVAGSLFGIAGSILDRSKDYN